MTQKTPPDCLLSFAEVAEILGLAEKTIRNGECGTDELLRLRVGGRTLFSFNDVQSWIARRITQAREERRQAEDAAGHLVEKKAEKFRRKQFMKDTVIRLLK